MGAKTYDVNLGPSHSGREHSEKTGREQGGRIASPRGGNMDCTMVAPAPVLPVGYVVSASRIADRRMILAGYRLADLLMRLLPNQRRCLPVQVDHRVKSPVNVTQEA
jgi:hypothetical protein